MRNIDKQQLTDEEADSPEDSQDSENNEDDEEQFGSANDFATSEAEEEFDDVAGAGDAGEGDG